MCVCVCVRVCVCVCVQVLRRFDSMLTDMVTEELVASGVNLVQYSQVSGSPCELDTIYRQFGHSLLFS